MAVTYNLKGTTNPSFKIGKTGNGTVYAENLEATSGQQLLLSGTSLTWTGDIVSNSIVSTNFYINDSADIFLDAAGGDVILKKGGGIQHGYLSNENDNFVIKASVADKDLIFRGSDNGSDITALTLDMSDAGAATFSGNVTVSGNLTVSGTTTTVDSTTIAVNNSFTFEGATADNFETVLIVADPTADRTVTIPDATGTISLIGGTETLTNKTLTTPVIAEITSASTITLDSAGDINLDSDSAYIYLKDAGTSIGLFKLSSSDLYMKSVVQDKDIIFQGNNGGSTITALTLDMSEGGDATFNGKIITGDTELQSGAKTTINTGTNVMSVEGSSNGMRLFVKNGGVEGFSAGSEGGLGHGAIALRGQTILVGGNSSKGFAFGRNVSWSDVNGIGQDDIVIKGDTVNINGALTVGSGSNPITDTKVGQWDTSYGYGNHASAGYLSGTLGFPTDLGAVTGSTTSHLGLGPDLGSIASGDTLVGIVKDFGIIDSYISLTTLKGLVSASTDFADFKTSIAGL